MSEGATSPRKASVDEEQTDTAQSDIALPSTPEKVFKYSEHIHKDRHIFLGPAYLSMYDMNDDFGDGYGFSYNNIHFPSLSKVSLSLDVFHSPPQKRFNETINTYVDTRKRIRMVQCVEDFERRYGPSPLPYVDRSSNLGRDVLRTSAIRKPEVQIGEKAKLPPLKGKHGDLHDMSYPFKLHKEGTFNAVSAMPVRYTIKPMSLWRQRTDTFLYGKKLNMHSRVNVQGR